MFYSSRFWVRIGDMHIYFSGIGGAGIGPLALVAQQAGYAVSGSDKKPSQYTDYLLKHGVELQIGQETATIAAIHAKNPIDWIVISSAVTLENPNHPEVVFANKHNIKLTKRDECLNLILTEKQLKLIAVAGTHGKTTTTAMIIWVLRQLHIPISYSVGAKISFGDMGHYDIKSEYFVYECDEFDRNFLGFNPYISAITAVDWDHHEIYPTRDEYKIAFKDFIQQSKQTVLFGKDAEYLHLPMLPSVSVIDDESNEISQITIAGLHNRRNAFVAIKAIQLISDVPIEKLIELVSQFPGSQRRFEQLSPNIYTDYAHTPEEIAATLQLAKELSKDIVVVYEPLTNRRQQFMKEQYKDIFSAVKKLYWLPSYLAREDPNQAVLSPKELIAALDPKTNAETAKLDQNLIETIKSHADSGDLVICMAGGGGNSLDEFMRTNLKVQ